MDICDPLYNLPQTNKSNYIPILLILDLVIYQLRYVFTNKILIILSEEPQTKRPIVIRAYEYECCKVEFKSGFGLSKRGMEVQCCVCRLNIVV